MNYYEEALKLHEKHQGKIHTELNCEINTMDDMSVVYTPGVAEPCRKIAENEEDVYRYTTKSNTIAVVSNGTAVLGLGNIGAKASIPVMEGKAALFKKFGDVNAVPICLDTQDKEELIMQVRKAKYGDKEAFCNLVRINKVAIYRIAKSILTKEEDIEDAVSEAILKAYKNIKTLKNDDFFKTWLIRIVINESNNLYKKRQREIAFEKDHFSKIKVNDTYKDLTLHNAINSLDDDLRTITILFYFEDLKYKDIAKVLGIKEGTVKSRLSRAKERLFTMLKEEFHG